MIARQLNSVLRTRVLQTPVVALLGSRQVAKTTLARALKVDKPTRYLDLELPQQSSETLAGRISYLELHPLNLIGLVFHEGCFTRTAVSRGQAI